MFNRKNGAVVLGSALALLATSSFAVSPYEGLIAAVSATDIVAALGGVALVAVVIILARNGFHTVLAMIRGSAK